LRLIDRDTGTKFFEADVRPTAYAWSPDATLVAATDGQELRVWTVAGAKLLIRRPVPADLRRIAFTQDNRHMLLAWGRIRTRLGLYSWSAESMLAETCAVLRRNLRSTLAGMRPDPQILAEACPGRSD
jgi:hypothetical protein